MKKFVYAVSLFSVALLASCGSSSGNGADVDDVDYIYSDESEMRLDISCNSANEGKIVYLIDTESAKVCQSGYWRDHELVHRDTASVKEAVKDSVDAFADLPRCSYSTEDSVIYVRALKMDLVCDGFHWREQKLYSLPVSVSTIKALPTCVPSISGAIIYVSSVSEDMICSEKRWVEYDRWLQSSSSENSSSSDDDDYYSSSSRYITSSADRYTAVLGVCNSDNDRVLVYDTSETLDYNRYGYYYCDGDWESWESATSDMLDTVGWGPAEDGVFRAGSMTSSYGYGSLPGNCKFFGEIGKLYYVFDGWWRKAKDMEVCALSLCNGDRTGNTVSLQGYEYRCDGSDWVFDSLYSGEKVDRFKKGIVYGSLVDERDENVYKTVEIAGLTWMAENLRYADSASTPTLKSGGSSCLRGEESNCEIGGRSYRWASAMNLSSSYNSTLAADSLVGKTARGICPEGWHVPDSTDWASLLQAANGLAANLKSETSWPFDEDVTLANNYLGFTAVPAGYYYSGSDYSNTRELFCSAEQANYSTQVVYEIRYYKTEVIRSSFGKTIQCHLRCVKDAE